VKTSATHPLKTIATLLDLSERRVQQLSREGVIPKSERGRYELVPAVQGYVHYLRDRNINPEVISLDVARQRKTAAEAELAEIELAKARADVVSIEDVAKRWDSILSGVRARMLALPTKVAPMVTHENDQGIVKECIENVIHTALGELSAGLSDDAGGGNEPDAYLREEPAEDVAAAVATGLPLTTQNIDEPGIREMYGADYVLVRPDGHVAWRGNDLPKDAAAVIDTIRGM
jgi:phage terminase Nu1 subunit (DNA packaging protein)